MSFQGGYSSVCLYNPEGHLIEAEEALPVFLGRIYEEEGKDVERVAKRTYMEVEAIRQILGV